MAPLLSGQDVWRSLVEVLVSEMTVRSVLRIVAVVTVLIGLTETASALGLLVGASQTVPGQMGSGIAYMALVCPVIIMGEGWLLYMISSALAQKIVR